MRMIALLAAVFLAGCASIQYADGKTVSLRHVYKADQADLQATADVACAKSGGKTPATLIASVPMGTAVPALADWISSFRCAQ